MKNTNFVEYEIDKNYIYKNPSEEIKELLKENEKIKLVLNPKYVTYGFQLAKELNQKGIANFDEELKVERDFKDAKRKTKIYISLKRKSNLDEYLIEDEHYYENIYENIKQYLKTHDKVKIIAKTGEVGIAFKVAKKLISKGIASYDEELKLSRDFKTKGSTKVYISLKKKQLVKEYLIKQEANPSNIIVDMKHLFKIHEKVNIVAKKPNEVSTAFKVSKKLIDEGIATYDEELNIKRNFKYEKERTKALISLKRKKPKINEINTIYIQKNISLDDIIKEAQDLLQKDDKLNLIAKTNEVGFAFKIAGELYRRGYAIYDKELKIKRNFKEGKGSTEAIISLKRFKKKSIKESEGI